MKEVVRQLCAQMYEQAEWAKKTLANMRAVIKEGCQEECRKEHDHERRNHVIRHHVEVIRAFEDHAKTTHDDCCGDHGEVIREFKEQVKLVHGRHHADGNQMTPKLDKHLTMFEKGGNKGTWLRNRMEESVMKTRQQRKASWYAK